jgi:hypothetical protein
MERFVESYNTGYTVHFVYPKFVLSGSFTYIFNDYYDMLTDSASARL